LPARKRRTTYPPPRTATRQPTPGDAAPGSTADVPYIRPTVAAINLSAGAGRAGLKVGDRVRITGAGLYSGEIATIDKLSNGVIPSAVVRTESGRTRQVRTIDLEPVGGSAAPAAAASPAPAVASASPAPAAAAGPAEDGASAPGAAGGSAPGAAGGSAPGAAEA
jgi:hypothetical protein